MKAIEEINFQAYLESVLNDKAYSDCRHFYTPTDGAIRPNLYLMVKRYQSPRTEAGQESKTKEVLSVLDGLRKYQSEHVLLVGKPGSGKSTALEELLLDEAEKAKSDSQVKIPVLVRLRQYQTSVLDLVRDFLMGHGFSDIGQLEQLLLEGRFLLLLDGVNELPSQTARTDLENFRVRYRKFTPMILTTRDLSFGGTVGVEHKLEMEPLTVPQMNKFVQGYLPDQHKQMLQQMGDRLQQFAETPLLLVMLCDVFKKHQKIPTNLGEAFRDFTQIYDTELRQKNVPTSENSQVVWSEVLQHLAFFMMQGSSLTEFNLRITKQKATELIQEKFRKSYDQAFLWLEDLLRYHLIQEFSRDQVEFRHQLIQEYYAAEHLLKFINNLDDKELKQKYLNYLKWTESLTLMLGIENDPQKAVRLVKLGLEVDPLLGSRLAGAVKLEYQKETIQLVDKLSVSDFFKAELLGTTLSIFAVDRLEEFFQVTNIPIAKRTTQFLGVIGEEKSLKIIIDQLENLKSYVAKTNSFNDQHISLWHDLIQALAKISQNHVIEKISTIILGKLKSVSSNKYEIFIDLNTIFDLWLKLDREHAVSAVYPFFGIENSEKTRIKSALLLSRAGIQVITPELVRFLYEHRTEIHDGMLDSLFESQVPEAMSWLISDIQSSDSLIRKRAVERLIKIKSLDTVPRLSALLHNSEWDVKWAAALVLGSLGRDEAITILQDGLKHQDALFRKTAVITLSSIKNEQVTSLLIATLNDPVYFVRRSAAIALGNLGLKEASSELIDALRHYYPKNVDVNKHISVEIGEKEYSFEGMDNDGLARIGDPGVVLQWRFETEDFSTYVEIAKSLLHINSEAIIDEFIDLQDHLNPFTQRSSAIVLGILGDAKTRQDLLLETLTFYKYEVVHKAIQALSELKSRELITQESLKKLLVMLHETDYYALTHSAIALDAIGDYTILDRLSQDRLSSDEWFINFATEGIQNRCKFYSHKLTQEPIALEASLLKQKNYLRIVVASPGDVQTERDLLPGVIDELNRNIAADRNLSLELVRWETDSIPGFHPEGPQGLIDSVLKIEDCDILIGIFWKRFGTPVRDANSGTEHEFLTAYEAWKQKSSPQIMIYFNQKPYNPSSSKESEQWTQVLKFKENFPKEGLWCKYEGEADFERKVRNDLTQFIRNHHPNTVKSSPSHSATNIPSIYSAHDL